jgi:hypothetical protein
MRRCRKRQDRFIEALEKRVLLSGSIVQNADSQSAVPAIAGLTVTSSFTGGALTSGQTIALGNMTAAQVTTDTLTVKNSTGDALILDDPESQDATDSSDSEYFDLGISENGIPCGSGKTTVMVTPTPSDNGSYDEELFIGDSSNNDTTVFKVFYTFTIVPNGISPNKTLTLSSSPQTDSGVVTATGSPDGQGNDLLNATNRLLYFTLSASSNLLTLKADPADNEDAGDSLQVQLIQDSDDNGTLSVSELDSAMPTWTVQVGSTTTLTNSGNDTLSAGSYFLYLSIITPVLTDSSPASFSITDNLTISATAIQPPVADFTYTTNGQPVSDNESTPTAANGTDFGTVAFNSTPVSHEFTVTNDGGSPLQFGSDQTPADGFAFNPGLTTSPIAPGDSATFTLVLPTDSAGPFSGNVIFTTNIPGESTFQFAIQGTVSALVIPPGWVDTANMDVISGWADDPSNPTTSINVEVAIIGGPTQTISANETRSDLLPVVGSTNHGFTYSTPVLSVGNHTAYIYAVDVDGTKVLLGTETLNSQNSLFDEHYYLTEYPNVAAEVKAGEFLTGYDQYYDYGQYHGYNPSPYWDEAWYLQENPDVAAAVKAGTASSGFMNYYLYGQYENRPGLLYFNTNYYLQKYPSVATAISAGLVTSAFEHYVLYGQYYGLSPMKYFSSTVYDGDNQDILPYVTGEPFSSDFEQFVEYGQYENRIASNFFNNTVYLADNPDVNAAVNAGEYPDAFQQWLEYGQYEGRTAV